MIAYLLQSFHVCAEFAGGVLGGDSYLGEECTSPSPSSWQREQPASCNLPLPPTHLHLETRIIILQNMKKIEGLVQKCCFTDLDI